MKQNSATAFDPMKVLDGGLDLENQLSKHHNWRRIPRKNQTKTSNLPTPGCA